MAFPEKVTYNQKYNLRPIIEPDGQFSAEDANQVKEKVNKNALFYDVHDNLAALQVKFPNPPVGAFAYIIDGRCYRCVNLGWTTDSGGSGSVYFKGYHPSLSALKTAHPVAVPGARAIIKVEGKNDKEALWDEDAQDWFEFEIIATNGNLQSPNAILSFAEGHQQNLDFQPLATFRVAGITYSDTRPITAQPADAVYDRFDLWAIDMLTKEIILIKGDATANPSRPNLSDPVNQLDTGIFISIKAGATAPTGVAATTIYAEGAAGEFSAANAGPSFNLGSTNTPHSGSKCVETLEPLFERQVLPFVAPAPVPIAQAKEVQLWIKNKTGGYWEFLVQGNKSNGRADSFYVPVPANYDPNNLDWQLVIFPIASNTVFEITKFSIVAGFDGFEYFLDDMRYLSGTENVSGEYATIEYVNAQDAATLEAAKDYADAILVAGNDHVHDSYADMAAMIADQANQIDGEYFVVIDAVAHSTVDAGWAFFEYLGTTIGDETDYRKLSEQESLDVVYPPAEVTQAEHDALAARVAALEAEGTTIIVATSRNLAATDSGKKLLVTAAVTLTWPSGIPDFECNFDIDSTGQLTIDDAAAGANLDAPDGTILEAGKMAHAYYRPDTGRLRLKGTFIV